MTVTVVTVLSSDGVSRTAQDAAPSERVPVFRITGGVPPETVERLMGALGIPGKGTAAGGLDYFSPRFGRLPMKPQATRPGAELDEDGNETTPAAFDLSAVRRIEPVPEQQALNRIEAALEDAGLETEKLLAGGVARPDVGHSQFTFQTRTMARPTVVDVDTQVDYSLDVDVGPRTVPIIGPGAALGFTLDSRGRTTEARVLLPALERGEDVDVLTPAEAEERCASRYSAGGTTPTRVAARLVYFLESAAYSKQEQVQPSFACSAEARVAGETVALERLVVPAPVSAPAVAVTATLQDDFVIADAVASRGSPPYTIRWSSSSGSIPPAVATSAGTHVEYQVVAREDATATGEDVCATVTDANGLEATSCRPLKLVRPPDRRVRSTPYDGLDVGTETSRLSDHADPNSFAAAFERMGVTVEFNWHGTNAWERDFKASGIGSGQDNLVVDAVDLTYYPGAGSPDWVFMREPDDFSLVPSREARWGDNDLEWLAMATCSLLNRVAANDVARSFRGLHTILGYTRPSYATDNGGEHFVRNLYDPMKVREAWAVMSSAVQPTDPRHDPTWALMGPLGPGGMTNYDDYFWGLGRDVTPDITPDKIRGWYHFQSHD